MSTDHQFKLHLHALILGLALIFILTGLFNYVIDPYGIWQVVRIKGLNWQKSERRDQNYLFKAVDLIKKRPRTLLLGSSRAAFALNPDNPVFTPGQLKPVYNAALTGGHMHALRRYVEHAIYNNPDIKLIIWGMDFFAFNRNVKLASSYREDRLGRHHLLASDVIEVLWSLDALNASWRTINSNRNRPKYTPYFDNGQLSAMDMASLAKRKGMIKRFDNSLKLYLNSRTRFADYQDSPTAWQELEHVLQLARKHDITMRLYISPVHMAMFEALHQRKLWSAYKDWLRHIARLHPLTDFSGPGPITGEAIRKEMNYYWDVSHFRSEVGDRILTQLLNDGAIVDTLLPAKLVGHYNIDEHISKLEERTQNWLQQHPHIVRFVAERVSPSQ